MGNIFRSCCKSEELQKSSTLEELVEEFEYSEKEINDLIKVAEFIARFLLQENRLCTEESYLHIKDINVLRTFALKKDKDILDLIVSIKSSKELLLEIDNRNINNLNKIKYADIKNILFEVMEVNINYGKTIIYR